MVRHPVRSLMNVLDPLGGIVVPVVRPSIEVPPGPRIVSTFVLSSMRFIVNGEKPAAPGNGRVMVNDPLVASAKRNGLVSVIVKVVVLVVFDGYVMLCVKLRKPAFTRLVT